MDNEGNSKIDEQRSWGKPPTRQTTANINIYLWEEAKRNLINFKEALEFGIKFLIADKEGYNYPASKQTSKIERMAKIIQDLNGEINKLSGDKQVEEVDPKTIKDEVDKVFGGKKDE